MKIVSFWRDQEVRVGILVDEAILDVASAASAQRQGQEPYFHDALSFIRGGKAAMVAAEQLIKQRPVDALLSETASSLHRRYCLRLFSAPVVIIASITMRKPAPRQAAKSQNFF